MKGNGRLEGREERDIDIDIDIDRDIPLLMR